MIGVCDLVAPAEKEDSGFRIPIPVPVPVPVLIFNKTTRDVSSLFGSNLQLQLKQKSFKCKRFKKNDNYDFKLKLRTLTD